MSLRFEEFKKMAIPQRPELRTLAWSTLINTLGNGLFMTVEVIYFTMVVGLSVTKVALTLSIAGGISLIFSVPAGHLSDRYGPRDIGAIAFIFEGLFLSCLVFVHSYTPFLLINIACGVTGTIGQTMRMATISKLGTGDERVAIRAYQRTVTNLGIAIGSVVAGIALAINTQVIYQAMLLANALTFIISALVFLRLPYIAPTVEKSEPLTFEALKDRRFLGATVLNGFMSLHFVLQTVAIPLWIVNETKAPRWWVSVIFVINTVGVILFQIRASRGSGDISVGALHFRRAGFAVGIACLLYALASGVSTVLACLILVAAMCVHVFGEVVGSAGSWSIGFGLADEKHQGQYQGVYSLSWGVGGTIGPAFVTAMAITIGQLGWVYMAVIFTVTGVLMYRLVTKRWLVLSN
jgi:MFS family permease